MLPPNPGELIETVRRSASAMEVLLEGVRSAYDLVVIDTPPLTAVSDAFPLLGKVSRVVIVGRMGRNRRDVASRLHETLAGAGAPLLGVIANGLEATCGSYGYSYDYSHTPDKQSPPTSAADVTSPNDAASSEETVPTAAGSRAQ